jgi:hypothetical protein
MPLLLARLRRHKKKIAETGGIHWNECQFLEVTTKVFVN